MRTVICIFIIAVVLITGIESTVVLATEAEKPIDNPHISNQITSAGAIVIDFETGDVLYAHNADVLRNPASMTKMMTVYLVYEAIENGQIDMDTMVPISAYAAEFSQNPDETNVPLSQSGKYTVSELLDAVVVVSAGGAAQALAELVGGTRRDFIQAMNEKAEEWEIDATYAGVSGGGANTKITPRAMATLVRNTIMQFPQVLEKTSLQSLTFANWTYPNTNKLLGVYEGIDGYKTGTNSSAKENFSATAQRGDIRIITVTMGSDYGKRFDDTVILLDYGFSVMEERLAKEKARLEEEVQFAEEQRIEEERRRAENIRLAEEKRLAEEAMLEEAQRLEAEKTAEAQRLEIIRLEKERINAETATKKIVVTATICLIGLCAIVIVVIVYNYRQNKKNS